MQVIGVTQKLKGLALQGLSIKLDGSLLTDTDLASEDKARYIFAQMMPGAAFGSEEGACTTGRLGVYR